MARSSPRRIPEIRAVIRAYIAENKNALPVEDAGLVQLLDRFSKMNRRLIKKSSRLLYASMILATLYWFVTENFRLEASVLGQRIFDLPYLGVVSLLLAVFAHVLAQALSADAKVYDHYVREICREKWGRSGDLIYRSYVGEEELFFNLIDIETERRDAVTVNRLFRGFSWLSSFFAVPLILIAPVSAAHFLYFHPIWPPWTDQDAVSLIVLWVFAADILAFFLAMALVDTEPDDMPATPNTQLAPVPAKKRRSKLT